MSRFGFNRNSGPILVFSEITGPAGSTVLKLVLDTGATRSLVNIATLRSLGFDPDQSAQQITMMTGSAVEVAPRVMRTRLSALGQHRYGFSVIAHSLPPSSAVDGLLGLDFLRDLVLTINFKSGQIGLT